VARAVDDAFDPVGLNIFQNSGVASGQRIPHYHVHVMPRYPGESPDTIFGKDAVLVPFAERARLAESIAEYLPSAAQG
jgi:histidine triad (HIT) family protein